MEDTQTVLQVTCKLHLNQNNLLKIIPETDPFDHKRVVLCFIYGAQHPNKICVYVSLSSL